ncbi:hypothetical protein AYI68_g3438 [Smittium mucronatum]|uniref:Uncharacterized protein n=1 Tax=Smittium mucronatum TaxID=133383 RepID=A0A1R0GZX5_9FUNG|nr:hypothetical protein AYI68_g3438 [Smittium mucronatum]
MGEDSGEEWIKGTIQRAHAQEINISTLNAHIPLNCPKFNSKNPAYEVQCLPKGDDRDSNLRQGFDSTLEKSDRKSKNSNKEILQQLIRYPNKKYRTKASFMLTYAENILQRQEIQDGFFFFHH